jgi:UDP-N-acetylmuramoyl-tripeptide--D-alanyl-D-alanine ligase
MPSDAWSGWQGYHSAHTASGRFPAQIVLRPPFLLAPLRVDLPAEEIARICAGRVVSGDPQRRFHKAVLDSRGVPSGALFVALPGERHDGHDFLDAALADGAGGALVMRDGLEGKADEPCRIRVVDTTHALQALAAAWRRRHTASVVGIAGSNGKTTTKETLAAVLGAAGHTHATPGNANSQVGSPLAILHAPDDSEFMVLELGTSMPGELARISAMAAPDHAIITAAFDEHLEFLKDIDGVVAEETTILDALPAGALALIGSAEPRLVHAARKRSHLRVESLGVRADDDWRLHEIEMNRDGTTFLLAHRDGSAPLHLKTPLLGEPAAWAAAFSAVMARELGLADATIQRGLADVQAAVHRLVAVESANRNLLIVDDCYNSNPAACIAAIEATLALHRGRERLILVLGDMLELGEVSEAAHREVGTRAAELAPRATIVGVGPLSRLLGAAARARGADAVCVDDARGARQALVRLLTGDASTTLLLKASRGIALESLLDL